MILFTTFASSISFFVFGLVLVDYAIVGFLVGVFSASIGQILMRQARQARSASGRDFERNSFTAFAIGGVILISALLMTIEVCGQSLGACTAVPISSPTCLFILVVCIRDCRDG